MNDDLTPIINTLLNGAIEGTGSYIATNFLNKIKSFINDRDNLLKKIIDKLSEDLKDKEIVEPERSTLIQSVEGMLLNENETPLHEMFYNLLKSSMDKNTSNLVHPAFIQILKQLSPEEARFLLDVYNDKISRNYYARGDNQSIYDYDYARREQFSIITYKDEDSNNNYNHIYQRLYFFNLILIKETGSKKDVILGAPPEEKILVKDKVILSKFGNDFIKICYNDKCKELLEMIDLKKYFESISKK